MGYYTTFRGEIHISPPAPWSALKDSKWTVGHGSGRNVDDNCIGIQLEEEVIPTDEGATIRRKGTRIIACEDEHRHYDMTKNLQAIVDELGPGYSYTGRFDAEGEETGDMWRLKVIGGKAVEFRPELIWPEESE